MQDKRRLAMYVGSEGKDSRECYPWLGFYKERRGKLIPYVYDHGRQVPAARWVYEQLIGPIPEGQEIAQVCRNWSCVNTQHLKAVSHSEAIRYSRIPRPGRKAKKRKGNQ